MGQWPYSQMQENELTHHEVQTYAANVGIVLADGVDAVRLKRVGGRRAQGQVGAVLARRLSALQ